MAILTYTSFVALVEKGDRPTEQSSSLFPSFLPRTVGPPLRVSIWMALGIFSEDCICTSLCGAVFGTFTWRKLECFSHALVVNALAWNNKIGLVAYFVGLCAIGNDE